MQQLILQFLYSLVIRNFLKLFVGVKFQNAHFLIKEKQFIIVANHNSHLDTLTILASLPSKIISSVKPVAAQDHFGNTRFKEKLSNYFINTLLIQRKRDKENFENDPIHRMIKALDDGYSLILFPEGTRSPDGTLQKAKSGIGLTVIKSEAPVVPVRVFGTFDAYHRHHAFPRPRKVAVRFGKPIDFAALRAEAKTCSKQRLKEIYQEVANQIMEAIASLERSKH